MTSPTTSAEGPRPHKKWVLLSVSIFFVVCGLGYLIYWLGWGQFSESTNDAYVNGNMIVLTPQEEGIVTTIYVDNTQFVEAGQPILELDRHDYEIVLEKARADLADTLRFVTQLFIKVEELQAKLEVSRAHVYRASLDYEHRKVLVTDGSVSLEDYEHSETAFLAAIASLRETQQELKGAQAEVENTTIFTHPKVEQAKAMLRKAFLGLHRCTVRAPTKGIITQRKAQVGQWVHAADPLMALVPMDQIWVDANFREVSLKNLRIGQSVELIADMYGSKVKFHGEVVGLNPGTGSIFSILPPQNATGNWIKIIQRIPVKINLIPSEIIENPLVLGLSMTVYVDTHDRNGPRLPKASSSKPIYTSDVYADELFGAEEIIEKIIIKNTLEYDKN